MRAFTLVEVLVALALLSVAALGLGHSLLLAQRAQQESGRWMRAAALADEALERGRRGECPAAETIGEYGRSCLASGDAGLRRVEVVVRWRAHSLRLATWVRP